MKALENTKIVELTIVLAIETQNEVQKGQISAMDLLNFDLDASIIGWSERDLTITYTDKENK